MIREWGEDGWRPFTEEGGVRLSTSRSGSLDLIDRAQVEIVGETAKVTFPDEPEAVRLKRVEGEWLIRAADIVQLPPEEVSKHSMLAGLLNRKRTRIGEPGVTPESLDAEVGEAGGRLLSIGRGWTWGRSVPVAR